MAFYMGISVARISANQNNAKKSTGPVTEIGKRKVSGNAIKHGIFSKDLLLCDEDPVDYQTLLEQLQSELKPVGVIEQSLVERITVSLWRQKRLIRAEAAYLESERVLFKVAAGVSEELGLSHLLTENDLTEFSEDEYQWCLAVLKEYETIDKKNLPDVVWLKNSTPIIYSQLLNSAENQQQSPEEFLQQFDRPIEYFVGLAFFCKKQIKQAVQKPLILEIAELVRSKRVILKDNLRESLSHYQMVLDNALYKAIRELRLAQEWRKTL